MDYSSRSLFIGLLHRLYRRDSKAKYADALVLHYLLWRGADKEEVKTTITKIALDALEGAFVGQMSYDEVKRSVQRLIDGGFIRVRVYKNHHTLITVNRDAVLELLAVPLPKYLPGIEEGRHFAFLDAWKESSINKSITDLAEAETPNVSVIPTNPNTSH